MISDFIGLGIGFVVLMLLSLLGFAGLQWINIPVGSFVDWMIGGVSFWWLLVIVTVPWNVYFQAKQVLAEAALSVEKNITVDPKSVRYAQVLAQRSLWAALALHGLSAIGLYTLSATGISAVGYITSGAALLLTGLRPAIGAYQYFSARLAMIGREFTYPRQDIAELRGRVAELEAIAKRLEDELDPEQSASWVAKQQRHGEDTRKELARLAALQEELRATNQRDHDRLSREAQQAISQLTTDGQVLEHVREIIRFFKTA
jgi:hypothetical protein